MIDPEPHVGTEVFSASERYKLFDHQAREKDAYALAKYTITLDWLRPLVPRGATIFNIGCGGGVFNRMLLREGRRVIACEPNAEAYGLSIRDAGEHCAILHSDLERCADVVRGKADAFVMHDVLEHMADEAHAVEILRSLLPPRGYAVVSVPAIPWLFGYHDEQLGHYRRYTRHGLRRALSAHFDILRMRYFGFSGIPFVWYHSVFRRSTKLTEIGSSRARNLFRFACAVERAVYPPLGTSLLALLRG